MKKIKMLMIILGIGIILVLIILISLLNIVSNKENGNSTVATNQEDEFDRAKPINSELQKNYMPNLYFSVESAIATYMEYIQQGNAEAVEGILDEKYKSQNNINRENVLNKVENIQDFQQFKVKEMYLIEKEGKYKNYVYGIITMNNMQYGWYGEVNTDYTLFSIEPLEKEVYEEIIEMKKDTGDRQLIQNNFNQFVYKQISEEELCRYYLEDYRDKMLNDYETAFLMLDEQYKEKRFQNDISKFVAYIEENKEHIELLTLSAYSIYDEGYDGNRIVLEDNYNNYYVLYEKAVMDYTIQLDSYTIPDEEYIQKYNSLSLESRAINNVEIVINMINNKDYERIYALLDETFKNNNFPTVEVFKVYMKQHFFDYNIVGQKEIEEINGLFVCKIFLKDNVGSAYESREQTFIMKLGEGTDFVMSFQI